MWLGAAQPLGVVAQAVIGGIVVLTKLNPATVSVHFLVSAAVVAAAVALHMRCTALADASEIPETTPVRRDLRVIVAALVAVTCLMLTAGTVVTGTGPLAGDAGVPRYPLPLEGVTQFHADIGWLLARPVHRPGARAAAVRRHRGGRSGPAGSCSPRWDRRASSATSSTSPTSRPGWSGST